MTIEANSEGDLGLSMEVATDTINAEPGFIVIIHLGEPCGHRVVGVDLDEARLIRGAMITIAWVDGHGGTDLFGDVETPLGVIGEVKEALQGTIRCGPGHVSLFEHGRDQGGRNVRDLGRDLGGEVGKAP